MLSTVTLAQFESGLAALEQARSLHEAVTGFGDATGLLRISPATSVYVMAQKFAHDSGGLLAGFRKNTKRVAGPIRELLSTEDGQMSPGRMMHRLSGSLWPRVQDPVRDVVLPTASLHVSRADHPRMALGGLFRFRAGGGIEHVWHEAFLSEKYFNPFSRWVDSHFPTQWAAAKIFFTGYCDRIVGGNVHFDPKAEEHSLQVIVTAEEQGIEQAMLRVLSYPKVAEFGGYIYSMGFPHDDSGEPSSWNTSLQQVYAGPSMGLKFWLSTLVTRDAGWLERQVPDVSLDPEQTQYVYFPGGVIELEGVGVPIYKFPIKSLMELFETQMQAVGRQTVSCRLPSHFIYANGEPPIDRVTFRSFDHRNPLGLISELGAGLSPDWEISGQTPRGGQFSMRWIPVGPENCGEMMDRIGRARGTSVSVTQTIEV